jgi:hypothetical protein
MADIEWQPLPLWPSPRATYTPQLEFLFRRYSDAECAEVTVAKREVRRASAPRRSIPLIRMREGSA